MLPPKKRAKIIAALKANPNASAVARQVGVSWLTVWRIAKRADIELTAGQAARAAMLGPKIPSKIRAKIIAALKANPNASRVARQVGGVCRATVGKIAKRTGIKLTDGRPARGGRMAKQKASPRKRQG
jgi:Helix-turn-helix domain of transposase family ISL3